MAHPPGGGVRRNVGHQRTRVLPRDIDGETRRRTSDRPFGECVECSGACSAPHYDRQPRSVPVRANPLLTRSVLGTITYSLSLGTICM